MGKSVDFFLDKRYTVYQIMICKIVIWYMEDTDMFIGREAELQFLESRYKAENGQLIVLYGRRRVGKTETLARNL